MRRWLVWLVVGAALAAWSCGSGSARESIRELALSDTADYTITAVHAAPSAAPGSVFDVTTTVCNVGGVYAPPTSVQLVISSDATIELDDPVIGWGAVPGLQPRQCDTQVTPAYAVASGAFVLGAIVDPWDGVIEDSESNNQLAGGTLGIGVAPDLVVTALSGPPSANGSFPIAATVCNQGTEPSPGAGLTLYASTDTTITGYGEDPFEPDVFVGWGFVGPLQPGQCGAASSNAFAPWGITGAFYLGAIIDEYGEVAELIESNNHATGTLIGFGDGPDLVVTAVSGPPTANGSFSITSTVCNQGTQATSSASVELYASVDTTIIAFYEHPGDQDIFLGWRGVGPLQPGQCDTAAAEAFAPWTPPGMFYLGAIVYGSWSVVELISSNNRTVGPQIELNNGP
jgi:hypothetical protein